MKILITGSNGQLGLELSRQLNAAGGKHKLVLTDIEKLDIVNQEQVFELVRQEQPDVIINCAAYTNVDACETDELNAFRVNAVGARNLSAAAYSIGAKMVQVSTDYVFDGQGSTPRKEYDPVNPRNAYGRSKAMGEKLVRETNPRHFIIRTAWLYGEGSNFVRTMLRLAKERSEVQVVDDQVGSPTSTVDLAQCIINLVPTENYGTYHATCEGFCSWYEFARKIYEITGMQVRVCKISTEELNRPAFRPKYSVMENYMLKLIGMDSFRNWEDALEDYLRGGNRA